MRIAVLVTLAVFVSSAACASSSQGASSAEEHCLGEALYYEAGGEGVAGMKAVAEVIFRRTQIRYYPASICGVVYQGSHVGRCVFSFTCDDIRIETRNPELWARCLKLAEQLMRDRKTVLERNVTKGATHFHSDRLDTDWEERGLVRTAKIGRHIFYRDPTLRSASR